MSDQISCLRNVEAFIYEFDGGMTNFDRSIDPDFEEFLKESPDNFGRHSAWDFNGMVWFDGEMFVEQIWVYGTPRAEVRAATLNDLMSEVNDEWGME